MSKLKYSPKNHFLFHVNRYYAKPTKEIEGFAEEIVRFVECTPGKSRYQTTKADVELFIRQNRKDLFDKIPELLRAVQGPPVCPLTPSLIDGFLKTFDGLSDLSRKVPKQITLVPMDLVLLVHAEYTGIVVDGMEPTKENLWKYSSVITSLHEVVKEEDTDLTMAIDRLYDMVVPEKELELAEEFFDILLERNMEFM